MGKDCRIPLKLGTQEALRVDGLGFRAGSRKVGPWGILGFTAWALGQDPSKSRSLRGTSGIRGG